MSSFINSIPQMYNSLFLSIVIIVINESLLREFLNYLLANWLMVAWQWWPAARARKKRK